MASRTITPVVPFPPISDDARALALAARGMAETLGGTFSEHVHYLVLLLREGPIRDVLGAAGGQMGERTIEGRILIADMALIVTPHEIATAASILYGPGQDQDKRNAGVQ